MNKKGQALIEFILILPLFILIMVAAFDWVRIIHTKTLLESNLDNYIYDEIKENNLNYHIESENNYLKYTISKNVEIYSPVLTPIISSNYEVKVERVVYDQS